MTTVFVTVLKNFLLQKQNIGDRVMAKLLQNHENKPRGGGVVECTRRGVLSYAMH